MMPFFFFHLSTLFGIGKLPKAPGTWGSLAALVFAIFILHYISWPFFMVITALMVPIGVIAADVHFRKTKVVDPPEVVVDELVGMWITLFPLAWIIPFDDLRYAAVAAFVLFRVFDIWKPWPISLTENNLKGGLGVMADDIVAGVMAAGVLWALGVLV